MAQPKINQQLIASGLNISRVTVSRCFTNHPGINPEHRARVSDLASKLGYCHMEKRSGAPAKRSRNGVIGVLICTELPSFEGTMLDNSGQKLLHGLSEFAQGHRFQLDFHYVHPDDKSLAGSSYARIPGIARRLWDGVALSLPEDRDRRVHQALSMRLSGRAIRVGLPDHWRLQTPGRIPGSRRGVVSVIALHTSLHPLTTIRPSSA